MGSSWTNFFSKALKMLALLCFLPLTCLAFAQTQNIEGFEIPQSFVSVQPVQDESEVESNRIRIGNLERENTVLQDRLRALEDKLNRQENIKATWNPNSALYHEEVMFIAENHNNYSLSQDDGVFTAPIDGLYIFQFQCFLDQDGPEDDRAELKAFVSGKNLEHFWNVANENDYYGHFSLFWTTNLKADDQLWLENVFDHSIQVNIDHGMYFMGKILI